MAKLRKRTYIIYRSRSIPDNPDAEPRRRVCLHAGGRHPLKEVHEQPRYQESTISDLAKKCTSGLFSGTEINSYDNITTIERPKILPGMGCLIEPVSGNELIEFLKEYQKFKKAEESRELHAQSDI